MSNAETAVTLTQRVQSLTTALESRAAEFHSALGVDPERFLRIVRTAIANNQDLAMCEPASVIGAAMEAAQCGLNVDPVLGEGSLVPYKGKAKFLPGYRGLVKLAIETEYVRLIDADVVHEKDAFTYVKGTEERLDHAPYLGDDDPGRTTAAYCKVVMKSGDVRFVVMTRRRIEDIRRRAPGGGSEYSPWKTDYDEMAKKTVIKNACKLVPLSPRADRALALLDYDESPLPVPAPGERDVTPPEKRRAGKRKKKEAEPETVQVKVEPEKKPETKATDVKDWAKEGANGGEAPEPEKKMDYASTEPTGQYAPESGDPPPPGDDDAPVKGKPEAAAAPADDKKGAFDQKSTEVLISDDQRAQLQTIVRGKEENPKVLIEGIIGREISRLSDLNVAEFEAIIQTLAPEEAQGGFLD